MSQTSTKGQEQDTTTSQAKTTSKSTGETSTTSPKEDAKVEKLEEYIESQSPKKPIPPVLPIDENIALRLNMVLMDQANSAEVSRLQEEANKLREANARIKIDCILAEVYNRHGLDINECAGKYTLAPDMSGLITLEFLKQQEKEQKNGAIESSSPGNEAG